MEDTAEGGSPRPSELRIEEAAGIGGLDYFIVACPKDVVMYEDAIRTSGHAAEMKLMEVAQLVFEASAT
jgi:Fe-S oxidoreductase